MTELTDIYCSICFEKIAQADLGKLKAPVNGDMFTSPDPHHGAPAPFQPGTEWEFMSCPVCRHRPFIDPDEVMIKVQGSVFATFEPFQLGYDPEPPTYAPAPAPAPEPEKPRRGKHRR